jgi:hypothetical protein
MPAAFTECRRRLQKDGRKGGNESLLFCSLSPVVLLKDERQLLARSACGARRMPAAFTEYRRRSLNAGGAYRRMGGREVTNPFLSCLFFFLSLFLVLGFCVLSFSVFSSFLLPPVQRQTTAQRSG